MKNKFTWYGLIAIILLGTGICFVGCKDEVNAVVQYVGKVVYGGTTTPFADLEVKVTNGDKIHCVTHTDKNGDFSLSVRVNEIDGSYYLLAGDSTCVPKKVKLGGYGQKKVDLGVIDVEGPTLPIVTTHPIRNVITDKATSGGNVVSDGRSTVTARGVCWSKSENPTTKDNYTTNGSGTGEFESQMTELEYNTVYYVRAYATNRLGTAYGNQIKFSTMSGKAEVKTDSVYAVTAVSAKCAGKVTDDGGFKVTARGVCWAKSPDPTTTDYIANEGSGKGTFVCALRNLDINAIYYVRAFATNETGTFYGEQVKIQTLDGMAVVELNSIKDITATSATVNAAVTYDCDIAVTERGVCWSTNQYPTIDGSHVVTGRGMGSYVCSITKLEYGTKYYVRAYATNSTGTAYSEQYAFTTFDGMAIVTTANATNITAISATCGGDVTNDGTLTVTARGVCYGITQYPTIEGDHTTDGNGTGKFTSTLSNLNDKTAYYYRAYAITNAGTSYGEQRTFTTKDGSATVVLGESSDIKAASAIWTATITGDGGIKVTERGFCYSTNQYPTIDGDHIVVGNGLGEFTGTLTKLIHNKLYYIRAYAINAIGTVYSEQKQFTTASGLPIVTTKETTATSITISSGGNILEDGGYTISARGICYSTTNSTPTINDNYTVAGLGIGDFSTIITNVSVNTTYYIRAYATNSICTAYGDVIIVTTGNGLPTITTANIGENVTETTANGGGQVTDDGGYAVTAYGICWNTLPYPTINDNKTNDGAGTGYFSSTINDIDITGSNTYYVRAYATNKNGTAYGEQIKVSKENLDYKTLPRTEYGGYIYVLYKDMGAMSFNEANKVCEELVFAGYDDWQIPENEVLLQIMTYYTTGWMRNDGKPFTYRTIQNAVMHNLESSAYYYATNELYGYVGIISSNYYEKCTKEECDLERYDCCWERFYYHTGPSFRGNVTNGGRIRPVRKYKATK